MPQTTRHALILGTINALTDIIIMSVMLSWVKRKVQIRDKGHIPSLFDKSEKPETN